MSTRAVQRATNRQAGPGGSVALRLKMPGARVPSGVDDDLARLSWPLLRTGTSREMLVGRLAVDAGLDTATAAARVERLLAELSAAGILS